MAAADRAGAAPPPSRRRDGGTVRHRAGRGTSSRPGGRAPDLGRGAGRPRRRMAARVAVAAAPSRPRRHSHGRTAPDGRLGSPLRSAVARAPAVCNRPGGDDARARPGGERRRVQPGQRPVLSPLPLRAGRAPGVRQRTGAEVESRDHRRQLSRLRHVAHGRTALRRARGLDLGQPQPRRRPHGRSDRSGDGVARVRRCAARAAGTRPDVHPRRGCAGRAGSGPHQRRLVARAVRRRSRRPRPHAETERPPAHHHRGAPARGRRLPG